MNIEKLLDIKNNSCILFGSRSNKDGEIRQRSELITHLEKQDKLRQNSVMRNSFHKKAEKQICKVLQGNLIW
jgi:hypothetical protein